MSRAGAHLDDVATHLAPVEVRGWRVPVPRAWQRHTHDDGLTVASVGDTTDPVLLRLEVHRDVPSFDGHVGEGIAGLQLQLTDPLLVDVEAVTVAGREAARALALHRIGSTIGVVEVAWVPAGDGLLSLIGSTSHRTRPTLSRILDVALPRVVPPDREVGDD
jgi:hypothetical protein